MTTTETDAEGRPPCPECDGTVRTRRSVETCTRCGWVLVQGAD